MIEKLSTTAMFTKRGNTNRSSSESWPHYSVETINVRPGFDLILSNIENSICQFHFEESADVFGIGFHLKGGAAFDLEGERFETRPLEVWASAAPCGSSSTFQLPGDGFLTASLRFSKDAARDMFDQHRQNGSLLDEMTKLGGAKVSVLRLAPLGAAGARALEAMFSTPYTGAARALFLESCALGLLAAQIDAADVTEPLPRDLAERQQMQDAREWLDVHLDNPPSIVTLARIVGVNDFKLKRSFKDAFGTTVFGYVRQRRMERAAAQLHGGLSVAEAADAAGYVCPRCFADAFRRHYGTLPSHITRAVLANTPAANG